MRASPTADDPRHYTTRDGRTMPVTGTHAEGEACATCQRTPALVLADSIPLGALVRWDYGSKGQAHGRVIEQGRTRVRLFWHSTGRRGARPIWRAARDLTRIPPGAARPFRSCGECEAGR